MSETPLSEKPEMVERSDLWKKIYRIVRKLELAPFDGCDGYDHFSITTELEAALSAKEGERCEWNEAIDKCLDALRAYNVDCGYSIYPNPRTGEPEQEQFDILGYIESFKRIGERYCTCGVGVEELERGIGCVACGKPIKVKESPMTDAPKVELSEGVATSPKEG